MEKDKCVKCSSEREDAIHFHVLEVQTLPVRGMDGEKKVQALGRFDDFSVCRQCAGEQLNRTLDLKKTALPQLLKFGAIFAAGVVIILAFWSRLPYMRFLGIAAMICGVLGAWEKTKDSVQKRKEFAAKEKEKALYDSAWEVLVKYAPKKSIDSNLTYIPVNSETLNRKNGDLMILYNLLPEIAVKAYDMIHQEARRMQSEGVKL